MPTYIGLLNYTDKGIQAVKDAPTRIDRAREAFRAAGGELKAVYLTMGQYDVVTIGEAPDDATVARVTLAIAGQGNIRSQTMRAFTESEVKSIVSGL
ncbi:MAG: GYD domain-containing protein [Chloroflexi bacterium]|nr:MAG: GYD domain-containing protein [Chloroflexota bacterium]